MSNDDIAAAVLECVGGFRNVSDNALCATRLRLSLRNPQLVNRNALGSINGVLGIADRGAHGIEIVFGPNLVRGVYRAFERLTGIFEGGDGHDDSLPARATSKFQVQITPETPGRRTTPKAEDSAAGSAIEDLETSALFEMLSEGEGDDQAETGALAVDEAETASASPADTHAGSVAAPAPRPQLLVLNGPNVNLRGLAHEEADDTDYAALLELCHASALEAGFASCACYQSNHEGDLVDHVQDACDQVDGIVVNASSYAYTSLALRDALEAVSIPTIEVQLGDELEPDGQHLTSYLRQVCIETVMDEDIESYRKAIFDLAEHLGL